MRPLRRVGDGWLPSLGGRFVSPEDAVRMQAAVDEGARATGRDQGQIERAVNVMGLHGAPDRWAEQLARIATELRFTTIFVGVHGEDPISFVHQVRTSHRVCVSCSGSTEVGIHESIVSKAPTTTTGDAFAFGSHATVRHRNGLHHDKASASSKLVTRSPPDGIPSNIGAGPLERS